MREELYIIVLAFSVFIELLGLFLKELRDTFCQSRQYMDLYGF